MKGKGLETTLWSILIVSLAILGWSAWRYPDATVQPPRTPVVTVISAVPYDCTASLTDLSTGEEWEVPSPCHRPADGVCVRTGGSGTAFRAWPAPCTPAELAGCDGAVTVQVTEEGITASCVPDSGNPLSQS